MAYLSGGSPFYTTRLFGLSLRSNQPIPGMPALPLEGDADVEVAFIQTAQSCPQPETASQIYASPGMADNGEPYFKVWSDAQHPLVYLGIQYTDGQGFVWFLIDQAGSQVQVLRTPAISFDDMLTYFLGPVIGCILRLRGITSLHAGVAAVGEKAIAIIGPKGMGKSTLIAAMAQGGMPVLSDDIAPLLEVNGRVTVAPGYPRLRLWPETIAALSGVSVEELPKILSHTEKRFMSLSAGRDAGCWRFQPRPLPLAAIYALAGRGSDDRLSFRSPSKAESLFILLRNTYPEYPLRPTDHAHNFSTLLRLAEGVPLREVILPHGLEVLGQTRDAILDDFERLL